MKLLKRYSKDTMFKAMWVFLILFAIAWIIIEPSHWPYVAGYLGLVLLISIAKRKSP